MERGGLDTARLHYSGFLRSVVIGVPQFKSDACGLLGVGREPSREQTQL